MAQVAQEALYEAVARRLIAGAELWGQKAHPDIAPAKTARPYVVYSYAGGGELNARVVQDAEIVLTIKIVSDKLEQAFTGSARLSELFNDADYGSAAALDAGATWLVLHVKQEGIVHLVENVDGGQVYHAGHRFRFRMERA